MNFFKKSRHYISAIIFLGMATAFIFVGCQEGTLDDLKENRIINLTVQQLDQNGGGEFFFSVPGDILAEGETAVQRFIENLEPEDIRKLGEKSRIASYLHSIGKTKLATQLSATNVPVDHSELSKVLSIQEVNELNTYNIEITYKGTGCSGDPSATHVADEYSCDREGQPVTSSYIFECINGNWIPSTIIGYTNFPCYENYVGSTYCNLDERVATSPTKGKNDLARFIAEDADNQIKDIIHHYILNKSEIDGLLENDESVKAAYANLQMQITQLYTLSDLNRQEIVLDAKTIETAQTFIGSLSQSVKSERMSNAFDKLGNSLDAAEGKELNTALKMIDRK